MKKVFSLLTSLIMAISLFSVLPTMSVGALTSGDYEYSILSDGTVEITAYNGTATTLTIPSTIAGRKVTILGCQMLVYSEVEEITIPNTVKSIESVAFYNCSRLKTITIPKSVEYIESDAFGCFYTVHGVQVISNLQVKCYPDTAGEQYAKSRGFKYSLIVPKPTSFKMALNSPTSVRLSWNKVSDADGYIIEQYKSGKWTRVAKLTNKNTTVYSVKKLASGTTYKFRMKAYKMSGGKAYYSGYTSTLTTCTKPATPKAKMALNSSVSVRLSWNKITGAGGYIVEQYKNGSWVRVGKVAGTSTVQYSVKGLASGTTYKFRVKAYKMLGSKAYYSAYSSTVTTCTKPATVKFTLTAGTNKATVKWNKVTGASGYIVYYRTSPSKGWTRLTKVGASTTSYTKTGLTGGKTYYFTVKAYKTLGGTPYYGGVTSKSVKPGMTESELKNKITSKYGRIGAWAYADYDGNGTKEAYAIIGEKEYISDYNKPGYLLFINHKGEITQVWNSPNGYYFGNNKVLKQGNKCFFTYTNSMAAPSTGFIFSVVNGKPHEFDVSGSYTGFTYENGQIYASSIGSNSDGIFPIQYKLTYNKSTNEFVPSANYIVD